MPSISGTMLLALLLAGTDGAKVTFEWSSDPISGTDDLIPTNACNGKDKYTFEFNNVNVTGQQTCLKIDNRAICKDCGTPMDWWWIKVSCGGTSGVVHVDLFSDKTCTTTLDFAKWAKGNYVVGVFYDDFNTLFKNKWPGAGLGALNGHCTRNVLSVVPGQTIKIGQKTKSPYEINFKPVSVTILADTCPLYEAPAVPSPSSKNDGLGNSPSSKNDGLGNDEGSGSSVLVGATVWSLALLSVAVAAAVSM